MVANESALATATTRFSTAAGLHVAITNKATVARATAADGAAIGLAVRVLNKAAVALLGKGHRACQQACQPEQCVQTKSPNHVGDQW